MFRPSHVSTLFLSVLLVLAALPALAQVSLPNMPLPASGGAKSNGLHGINWTNSTSSRAASVPSGSVQPLISGQTNAVTAPANAHLTYYDGPVISNVQVVQVLYGSGSYDPEVAGTSTPTLGKFFSDITNSGYISLLTQYSTNVTQGTDQTIGGGTFGGLYQITPSAANSGTTLTDAQIQAELIAQITAGNLPQPVFDAAGNMNTIYMIYFPPGVTTTYEGLTSCVSGGYCSYHGATNSTYNNNNLLYGVFPDLQPGSGCANVCGTSTTFGNYTSVSYHELSEAITDPDVNLAVFAAAPLAWYDTNNGEIADICGSAQGSYVANGNTYTVEYLFSDAADACLLPPAGGAPNFSLSDSPIDLSVTQGSNGTTTVTVTPINGFIGDVNLSASGLPSGVTATFASNPATTGSLVSFAATSTATTGTSMVTITGVSGNITQSVGLSLTINPAAIVQLFGNPGFEEGYRRHGKPWIVTPLVLNDSSVEPPHSGKWDAWLDGYGRTHTDTVTQTVTIPSTGSTATLSFWLHIDTAETTTTLMHDILYINVLDTSGNLLETLGTFSNLNHASGYQQQSFDVSSFIGQTVQIQFKGTENNSLQTSFVIDDTALSVIE